MAISLTIYPFEATESTSLKLAAPGDISTLRRRYRVKTEWATSDPDHDVLPGDQPGIDQVVEAAYKTALNPLWSGGSPVTFAGKRMSQPENGCSDVYNSFVLREIDAEPTNNPYAFDIIETYTTLTPNVEGFSGLYVKVSRSPAERQIPVWRDDVSGSALTFPTHGTPSDALGGADIGGKRIDIECRPWSRRLSQRRVTVDIIRDFSLPNDGHEEDPTTRLWTQNGTIWKTIADLTFKRNSSPMFGYPEGTLLYMGDNLTQTHHEFMIWSHNWLYDPWYHLEQAPLCQPDGSPIPAAATIGGQTVRQADKVWWYQRYMGVNDFWTAGLPFTAAEKAWFDKAFVNWFAGCG